MQSYSRRRNTARSVRGYISSDDQGSWPEETADLATEEEDDSGYIPPQHTVPPRRTADRVTTAQRPVVRAPQSQTQGDPYADNRQSITPRGVIRYDRARQPVAPARPQYEDAEVNQSRRALFGKAKTIATGSALTVAASVVLWEAWGAGAVEGAEDDHIYGNPRTYQVDAMVGHGDSHENPSHFTVQNLRGQIIVTEIPGSSAVYDLTHSSVYLVNASFGPGADKVPATVAFRDVNGDGYVDMIITLEHVGQQFVLVNVPAQKKFRSPNPGENFNL